MVELTLVTAMALLSPVGWQGSRRGVLLFGRRLRLVGAAAFATAAAGFLAGTPPHQNHGRDDNGHQEKDLLPIHASNITANAKSRNREFSTGTRLKIVIPTAKYGYSHLRIGLIMANKMNEPNENPRRYRWPWLVATAAVLGLVLAILWVGLAAKKIARERDLNAPLPASGPATR